MSKLMHSTYRPIDRWSPTIGTTQRPLTESLYTVAIELDGGTMLITTTINVPHTTERLPLPDFTVVFDEAELPTWVDALFGEDVADIFFETLTGPFVATENHTPHPV